MKKPEKVYPKTTTILREDIVVAYKCPATGLPDVVGPENMEFSAIYDDCEWCGSHGTTRLEWTCACGDWHEVILIDQ
jgi:hypothetical protein